MTINGKHVDLGRFDTLEEAALAAELAAEAVARGEVPGCPLGGGDE